MNDDQWLTHPYQTRAREEETWTMEQDEAWELWENMNHSTRLDVLAWLSQGNTQEAQRAWEQGLFD
ncbi:MAG: hypothetical protein LBK01_04250 [Burkholderiaceae bacterium]|jgi:hypothetical protein|nr:hypothetical protein [Burkholderiaceae bacterium]